MHQFIHRVSIRKLPILVSLVTIIAGSSFAGPLIKLQHATFDPSSTKVAAAASESDVLGNRYYLVQFQGPIMDDWKGKATQAGAELLDYIPDFAFVVRANDAAISKLKSLPFVQWVGDYSPTYRVWKHPKESGNQDVVIRLFPGADAVEVSKKVTGLRGQMVGTPGKTDRVVRSRVPDGSLLKLAATPGVAWIEPWVERKLNNNVARGITGVNRSWTEVGLYGAGQKVAVADTGLDNGKSDSTMSADFLGRVFKTYALGRRTTWSDTNGHGTHVAGTILGSGALSSSNPSTHSYVGSFAGVAPEAQLIFQSVLDSGGGLGGIPDDLGQLFSPAYRDGARVHNDSWGTETNAYTTDSYNTDLFVWQNKDMVICYSAGNGAEDTNPADGFVDSGSLDSPGTAKNCITVGATESLSNQGFTGDWNSAWGSRFFTDPIKSDRVSNNATGMAAWSSRGPTDDGRIKPDICAPGTNIISSRSHASGAGNLWGTYNTNYVYSGGTSMASPHVAGACALVKEFYAKRGLTASAALVKATLLNGALDITPGQYASPQEIPVRPNNIEGWGRLDIANSLMPSSPRLIYWNDVSTGFSTGGNATYNYYVSAAPTPLRVTLVWTDYPGSSFATKKLVNDLDLTITGPTGAVYRGNGTTDRTNNVEGIDIALPMPGQYTVKVSAYNVPQGPQPYSLVVSGAATTTQSTTVPTIGAAKNQPDGTLISMTGKIVSASLDQFKNQMYIQEPDRTSGIGIQFGPGGGPDIPVGATVSVTGTLTTVGGERVIKDPIVW